MNDAGWHEAEAALKAFTRQCGTVTRDEVDERHFGNRLIEASVGDVALRLVRDRGTPVISIGAAGRWHAPGKVLAFAGGESPEVALDRAQPSMGEIIANWPRITEILADTATASLVAFEEAVSRVYMDRVNIASQRLPVAAE